MGGKNITDARNRCICKRHQDLMLGVWLGVIKKGKGERAMGLVPFVGVCFIKNIISFDLFQF